VTADQACAYWREC